METGKQAKPEKRAIKKIWKHAGGGREKMIRCKEINMQLAGAVRRQRTPSHCNGFTAFLSCTTFLMALQPLFGVSWHIQDINCGCDAFTCQRHFNSSMTEYPDDSHHHRNHRKAQQHANTGQMKKKMNCSGFHRRCHVKLNNGTEYRLKTTMQTQ